MQAPSHSSGRSTGSMESGDFGMDSLARFSAKLGDRRLGLGRTSMCLGYSDTGVGRNPILRENRWLQVLQVRLFLHP